MYIKKLRGVAPVISTIVLLAVLITVTLAALYYVGAITMRSQAAGEAKMAKGSFIALAEQIERMKGSQDSTYKAVLSTRFGVPNIMNGERLTIRLDSNVLRFDQYTLWYQVPLTFFGEEPEELLGTSSLIIEDGPIPHVRTFMAGDYWVVELETSRVRVTYLYTEETPSGSREVYSVDVIVLHKGVVEGTSGSSTMHVILRTTNVEYMTLSDISRIVVRTPSARSRVDLDTPNIVVVTIYHITIDIRGGIGG